MKQDDAIKIIIQVLYYVQLVGQTELYCTVIRPTSRCNVHFALLNFLNERLRQNPNSRTQA